MGRGKRRFINNKYIIMKNNIRKIREKKEMSLIQFHKELLLKDVECSEQTLRNWEDNTYQPKTLVLQVMQFVLECNYEDLIKK